ncbi:hypothetical protein QAD02_010626 [Eretmocerus hayati]|uniref:Uncharacterized protein n=1 Tax=Eretmocerus hayati TaxID=131215 RepID=A0ACC2NUI3_9HYME|nr:hypothetical protein QAD02_010626 [Eretmocerus hayati]
MEEVDKIIIHSLRQIGCEIEEEVTNLAKFDTDLVIKAVVKCLLIIQPDLDMTPVLPANMAARFRMGATLAQICSDLGYKGDIGYQTFLYSAEADIRRVLMFLMEKMPKESEKVSNEPISAIAQLEKSISHAILSQISAPWLPHYCHKKRTKFSVMTKHPFTPKSLCDAVEESDQGLHHCNTKPSIVEQLPQGQYFVPSVIALNSRTQQIPSSVIEENIDWLNAHYDEKDGFFDQNSDSLSNLLSDIRLGSSRSSQSTSEDGKDLNIDEATDEDKIKAENERLEREIETDQKEIETLNLEIKRLTAAVKKAEKDSELHKEEHKIKKKAYELLTNGEENLEKLRQTIEAQKNKLIDLAQQWENHRLPLIEKYRAEKEKHSSEASVNQKQSEEMRLLKEKEKELLEEIRIKDQQYAQLAAEVQKLPKEVNRSAYTQRILEIINNIRKQKNEIDKILGDMRDVQKEINTVRGKLERSFAVVDEMIFRDARTNETSRKAYKLLAKLHSDCGELVKLVEDTGAIKREIRDLEKQIDIESAKNTGANLERITADLEQMRRETASLTAQLQSKNS